MDNNNKEKILFVDDSATVRMTAVKILSERYDVIEARDGEDAWNRLQHDDDIRIVFADIQMPVLNGLQLLSRIRNSDNAELSSLPVIMVTGESDTEATMRAVFEMGATDFIGKPFKAIDLQTRAYSYLKLTRKVKSLAQQSGIDRQTGISNATLYKTLGSKALSFATRHRMELTVAQLEICDFQQIKRDHGKHIADQILTTVASRLNATLRKEDIIARIGVARFAMIFPSTSRVRASAIIMRMRNAIHGITFETGRKNLEVTIASGFSHSDPETENANFDELNLLAEQDLMSNASGRKEQLADDTGAGSEKRGAMTHGSGDELLNSLLQMMEGKFSEIETALHDEILARFRAFSSYLDVRKSALEDRQ